MKILIFHASAGYGHKKVGEVIERAFLRRGLNPTEVTLEDALDFTSDFFSRAYPAIYYYSVRHIPQAWGWFYETFDRPQIYACIRPLRSWFNRLEGRQLLRRVQERKPDHIVCTHFFSAELLSWAKKEGKIKAFLTVVITDFFPHAFWINEGTDVYWVMDEESKRALVKRGVPQDKVIAGGIPVDPLFQPTGRKNEILKKCGLTPDRFTLLLTSGSFGLGPQEQILRELEVFSGRVQCLVVCGNNHRLQKKLEAASFPYPVKIFGFVDFMPELMEASDLIVAKSGGATTVESLAKGIPMIVLHPIPGQETRNAHYLKEHDVSFFVEKPEQIRLILQALFDDPRVLESKQRAIASLAKPHAVEDLLNFILKGKNKDAS